MSDIGLLDTHVSALLFLGYLLVSSVALAAAIHRGLRVSRNERAAVSDLLPELVVRSCVMARALRPLSYVVVLGLALGWWRHREGPSAVPFVPVLMGLVLATSWPLGDLVRSTPSILSGRAAASWVRRRGALLFLLHAAIGGALWGADFPSWGRVTIGELARESFASMGLLVATVALLGMVHAGLVLGTARWLARRTAVPPAA